MKRNMQQDKGFTLIELLVVMAISMFVLVAASKVMISMTTQFKQQTRISEKSIESGVGLQMIRDDIKLAGLGLPTGLYSGGNDYSEADWSTLVNTFKELDAADKPGSDFDTGAMQPPLMIEAQYPVSPFSEGYSLNGSSYLIIRSVGVGSDPIAGKFYLVKQFGASAEPGVTNNVDSEWNMGIHNDTGIDLYRNPDMKATDLVSVITTVDRENMGLVREPQDDLAAGAYATTQGVVDDKSVATYKSTTQGGIHIVYGISSDPTINTLSAPFNRVDYYVSNQGVPDKCAPGTGVLYKAEMQHGAGSDNAARLSSPPARVMDCVAMMQVEFALMINGVAQAPTDTLGLLTARQIRQRLRRVDVYILKHEGQFDPTYEYTEDPGATPGKIDVGKNFGVFEAANLDTGNVDANGVPYWKHFRWRVHRITEIPTGKGTFTE